MSSYFLVVSILTTTRDRATYDPSLTTAVSYTVASPTDAPSSLTYGPSFISLAADYGGEIVLGLNRRLNNIANTITAAKLAQSEAANLYAIELGNEPNCKIQPFFLRSQMLIQLRTQFTQAVIPLPAAPRGLPQLTMPPRSNGRMKSVAICPQLIKSQPECTLARRP
jgi:hypothetical protein